ncbi:MAG: DNA polymerase III subunit delta' [Bacteroidaceae bacterium]|nr:DNA polymerase III subunit delta' [Bacteroidaceae bacterium]
MYFKDIIGQDDIKARLLNMVRQGTIPHALLFSGPEGTGKLQMAIAFARFLLCNKTTESDSCGTCPSCYKMNKLVHPDLHFVYPVINKSKTSQRPTRCDDEIQSWRDIILEKEYFTLDEWLSSLSAENKQAQIFAAESDIITSKLSLKSTEGGYKIAIIWYPEKMHQACSNSLLKLLEEPPQKTVFILVSNNPEMILETITSRTQRIEFKRLQESEISARLQQPPYSVESSTAQNIAHISSGSWHKALQTLSINEESQEYLEYFMQLMRLAYARNVREIKALAETLAQFGREWQKRFLSYCQRMIRENFICNFHNPSLNFLTIQEQNFSSRFAPFVNERNIIGLMEEISLAQRHIEQNVNSRMVFFDLSLKLIILIKQ